MLLARSPKLALEELLNPQDPTNVKTREKTIEYIELQCVAGLKKMRDTKLAIADKLTSPVDVQARVDTLNLDGTNDRLAESVFGRYDYKLRTVPNISMEAASALAQAATAKSYEEGGAFRKLPDKEARALVEFARTTVRKERKVDAEHSKEQDEYHEAKRKSNSQLELDALVKEYAFAITFFKRWQQRGVASVSAMRAKLKELAAQEPEDERKQKELQLYYLREQIEMRVRGLGFTQFKTAWSSGKDEHVGTVDDLTLLLKEILLEEQQLREEDALPEVAVVPVMKRKSFKQLGTPTAQAEELAVVIKDYNPEELLEKAELERERLEEAGVIDTVADAQPEKPPPIDATLIGKWIEVCWARYWRKPTDEEKAKGDKRQRIYQKIWCECEVTHVANGTTTTEDPDSATCKKLADAGAVRVRWPEDLTREVPEKETFSWHIFQNGLWNPRKDAHLAWRFAERQLVAETRAARAGKRQRC